MGNARNIQIKGLKKTRIIANMEMGRAQFNELGISFTPLAMPIVYVESNLPKIVDNQFVNSVGKILDQTKFSLLMHSRLVWSPETCDLSRIRSKNNHWVLSAFKRLLETKPSLDAKLVLLEYGPDVLNTKRLISHLDLDPYIIWLPKPVEKT